MPRLNKYLLNFTSLSKNIFELTILYREISEASLTPLPDGAFTYYDKEKVGEWILANFNNSYDSQYYKLSGNLKLHDTTLYEFPS